MSARIRVVKSPWPERVGCEGVTVDDPGDGVYPFDKPRKGEVVVLLDDDPLLNPNDRKSHVWSCVMSTAGLEFLEER